jgi:hypothetical protein
VDKSFSPEDSCHNLRLRNRNMLTLGARMPQNAWAAHRRKLINTVINNCPVMVGLA